jgi:hypothetical protein
MTLSAADHVQRDAAIKQLTGGRGLDWFWLSESSKLSDKLSGFATKDVGTFE